MILLLEVVIGVVPLVGVVIVAGLLAMNFIKEDWWEWRLDIFL